MVAPVLANAPTGSTVDRVAIASHLGALRPGHSVTLIGIAATAFADIVKADPAIPRSLLLDLGSVAHAQAAIQRILDDLADLAVALWPQWPAVVSDELASLDSSWRNAAVRHVAQNHRPRFPSLPAETEFTHLLSLVSGLLLCCEVDPVRAESAGATIATLEWCRRHGAATVVLLNAHPGAAPPWDRILHGAVAYAPPPVAPAITRLIAHPSVRGSYIERRMRTALECMPGLAGLFAHEATLQLGALGPSPRVDLVWHDGKVVVELDGAEHERDPNYGADRHRDYELLVAGYLVLRLTNAEVELDLGRSLDKVQRVVNLRRSL